MKSYYNKWNKINIACYTISDVVAKGDDFRKDSVEDSFFDDEYLM